MRRLFLLFTVHFLLFTSLTVNAQTEATAVQFLGVELWPDYDQPAVLVLLTGTLPPDTSLPAAVTLPLPASSQLNAVARITADGIMVDDIDFSQQADSVRFITPDLQFRVEYYVPYVSEENGRSYTFSWQSSLAVAQLTTTIQQPAAATNLTISPTAVNVNNARSDGLAYHNLPTVDVPANTPYTVVIQYSMSEPRLSVELFETASGPPAAVPTPASTTPSLNTYFILAIVSGVFVIGYVGWHMFQRQAKHSRRGRTRPIKPQKARFCHQCGQKASGKDKFCRSCGEKLK
ncbi:MAG: zinc ribbon domain-containing protein [Chloroflexota bacterium]